MARRRGAAVQQWVRIILRMKRKMRMVIITKKRKRMKTKEKCWRSTSWMQAVSGSKLPLNLEVTWLPFTQHNTRAGIRCSICINSQPETKRASIDLQRFTLWLRHFWCCMSKSLSKIHISRFQKIIKNSFNLSRWHWDACDSLFTRPVAHLVRNWC